MYHTKEELIQEELEIHFIFDSLTTADDYELWWLVETDPLADSKVHSHPIDPEHLYYYDHDFEEKCQTIVRASAHNPRISFQNYYFDDEVIEEWVEDEKEEIVN
jgi:hypothetical protein